MREILFRGKRPNGQWVQGDLTLYRIDEKVTSKISFYQTRATLNGLKTATYTDEVIPETIGQYTGLTDDNDNKIFEGDIVKCFSSDYIGNPKINLIKVEDMTDYNTMVYLNCSDRLVIIGNTHDNPELLKEREG